MFCIEVDERQHKSYKDDDIRYDDLFMDFSGKYVFIRYNPDKYTDSKGKSCNPMFPKRMKALEKEIDKQLIRIEKDENTDLVEIIHLFFDGC